MPHIETDPDVLSVAHFLNLKNASTLSERAESPPTEVDLVKLNLGFPLDTTDGMLNHFVVQSLEQMMWLVHNVPISFESFSTHSSVH